MTPFGAASRRRDPLLMKIWRTVLIVCLAALAVTSLGCDDMASAPSDTDVGDASSPAATAGVAAPVATAGASESSSAASGRQSAASSSEDEDADSQTVIRENPGFTGVAFDDRRSPALFDAPSLDAVRWTVEPSISAGALVAEGVLEQGATLFTPRLGEGSAFSVYYRGSREPMVEVLPDPGPLHIWDTSLTVATMEFELEGTSFRLRAYSPLFMDVGSPSQLELRVFGFDESGADALLAVRDINAT